MNIDDLYPNRKDYYKRHLEKLKDNTNISDQNKADLKSFCVALLSTGRAKQYRAGKLLSQLIVLSEWLRNDFRRATLTGLQALIARINIMDRSEATKADYRRTIKQFYSWLEDSDERFLSNELSIRESTKRLYKYLRKDVTTKHKRIKIEPSQVIDDKDIKQIVEKGCQTPQEKAIFMILHETGMRVSDLLLTKINGFSIDERGIGTIFTGEGKTGSRPIDVIKCVPFIQEHLSHHPYKEDTDKPLLYFIDKRNGRIGWFNHQKFYHVIKKCINRAGFDKKSNPNWFRHSRASLDAIDGTMSETVRKKRMGWSDDSKMIANYTHLGTKEVKNAWLKANGLENTEQKKEEYITCICQRMISSSLSYCPYCGRPTSLKVLNKEKIKAKSFQEEVDELLPLMPSKPKQKKEFIEVIKLAMNLLHDPDKLREFEKYRKKI